MLRILLALSLVAVPAVAAAATLPPHGPLRLLVIGDAVNPHGLTDPELTQPLDLANALEAAGNGLVLAAPRAVPMVDSQCVDDALAALAAPSELDVVVYFAHQPARGCDATPRQAELDVALEAFLVAGGGVVVFHHGLYTASGKEEVLQLLGGSASSISWSAAEGQRVISVAPGHFVTTNSVVYAGTRPFASASLGIPSATYPAFINTPDERYPATTLLTESGEERTMLFASDDSAGARVLGYTLRRQGWAGRVVFYQPGEYQPNALDVDGANFQILANAIVYAAGQEPAVVAPDAGAPDASVADAAVSDAGVDAATLDAGPIRGAAGGCAAGGSRDRGGPFGLAVAVALFVARRKPVRRLVA